MSLAEQAEKTDKREVFDGVSSSWVLAVNGN
jgi:hypothetical protein